MGRPSMLMLMRSAVALATMGTSQGYMLLWFS